MAKNNGHWYTDKNGNHYFVEDGQTPQEGWEASKRRKMISGGKYMTSEDGNDYSEVDRDKYEAYEADEADFDENEEDDFGFDEEDDFTQTVNEMKDDNVNLDDPREVMQYLGANMGLDREDQVRFMERLGYSVNDIEKLRNPDDDFEDEMDNEPDEARSPYNEVDYNWVKNHIDDNPGIKPEELIEHVKEKFGDINPEDEMEIRKLMDDEYDREMKKAQEENARLSEGKDETRVGSVGDGYAEYVDSNGRHKLRSEPEDDLSDVENGTFTAYGKAGLEEIRDAKRRNYYIEYEKHDSAGDPRYTITIDKNRNYDGSPKNKPQEEYKGKINESYNYEDEGHYYKDGRWKPGNHKTNQWAPEYYRVGQKRLPNEPGQYEKDYTGDFPSLEKAQEFASKYQGNYPLNISKLQHQGNGAYRSVENQEYKRQPTGTQVFNNLKKYVDSLPDEQKEMLKDLLNNPRKK